MYQTHREESVTHFSWECNYVVALWILLLQQFSYNYPTAHECAIDAWLAQSQAKPNHMQWIWDTLWMAGL